MKIKEKKQSVFRIQNRERFKRLTKIDIHYKSFIILTLVVLIFTSACSNDDSDNNLQDGQGDGQKTFANFYPIPNEDFEGDFSKGYRNNNSALTTNDNGNITLYSNFYDGNNNYDYELTINSNGDSITSSFSLSDIQQDKYIINEITTEPDKPEYYTAEFSSYLTNPSVFDCEIRQEDKNYIIQQTTQERVAGNSQDIEFDEVYDFPFDAWCIENNGNKFDVIRSNYDFDFLGAGGKSASDVWIRVRNNQGEVIGSHVFWGEVNESCTGGHINFRLHDGWTYEGQRSITRLKNGGLFITFDQVEDLPPFSTTQYGCIVEGFNEDYETKWVYIDGEGNLVWDKWIEETSGERHYQLLSGAAELSDGKLIASYFSWERGDTNEYFEHFYIIDNLTGNREIFMPSDLFPEFNSLIKEDFSHYIDFVSEHPDGSILIYIIISTRESESETNNLNPGIYLLKLDPDDLSYDESNINL